ncbi:MAG: hypothetical protein HC853_02135 [Anaerolineae bacterium]|nr:hypothetical protein [Anaerolineae bacterium]
MARMDGHQNGELIQRVNKEGFDVVITSDQQWSYQQNRNSWQFGVIELSTNSLPILLHATKHGDLVVRLNQVIQTIVVGETIELTVEDIKGSDEE